MFSVYRSLSELGILGINGRNGDYLARYNERRLYPLVDNKLATKQLAEKAGVAVPELYGVIEIQRQVRDLAQLTEKHAEFALKPAHGSGGAGIVIVAGRTNRMYRKTSGVLITEDELRHHTSMILGGMYSLGGHPDRALIEYRVQFDPVFEKVSYLGVPDVRIIVFRGVPILSMVRLPTKMSDGMANLHQGAVGAGIDICTGRTTHAVWRNNIVHEHPDTGGELRGLEIPNWQVLLDIAARSYEMTGLGYQGIDLVLDRYKGPMLLELNARPGLNIQIANQIGLLKRLTFVEKNCPEDLPPKDRVAFALESFRS